MAKNAKSILTNLANNAPHKLNGSSQFVDDGLDAHAVHTGNNGGNHIDQTQAAAVGAAMLEALSDGEFVVKSVDPPTYADPTKLAALNASVAAGDITVKKTVTTQISEEGERRTKSVAVHMIGAPVPSVTVVYELPS